MTTGPLRRKGRARGWLLGLATATAAAGLLAVTLLPYALDARRAPTAYASGPDDADGFRRTLAADLGIGSESLVTSPSLLRSLDAKSRLYVVMDFEEPFAPEEAEALHDYVATRGGVALVADAFNPDAALASAFGVAFAGTPILDTANPANGTRLVATGAAGEETFRAVHLENATALTLLRDPGTAEADAVAEPILLTSEDTAMDLDGNGTIGIPGDKVGPFIVGLKLQYPSGGQIVFLGSPSILANRFLETESDNKAFLMALVEGMVPADARAFKVLVDEGRHHQAMDPVLEPMEAAVAATRAPLLAFGITLLAALLAALFALRVRGPEDWRHRYQGDRRVAMEREPAGMRESLVRIVRDRAPDGADPSTLVQDARARAFLFDNQDPNPEALALAAQEVRRIVQ